MRSRFITLAALSLIMPALASAQALSGSFVDNNPFTVSVNPQYPAPHSQATLSFLSTTLDLTNATLAVSVGGKNIYTGSVQPVTISLGAAGSITNVSAIVSTNGSRYTQTLALQPEDVVVVAEPVASTPPLYPGKASVPLEGDTRVVAVASFKDAAGKPLDPATLSYAWTVDDTRIADSSGIGKPSILVASPLQYRARTVSVTVQSSSGSLVGGASLTLNPVDPTIRVYENDPLLGIRFDQALSGSYTISGSEDTLYAAPFSFPTTSGAPLISWFLNGSAAQTGRLITLRPTGSGQGSANLSVTASEGSILSASGSLGLTFGAKPSTSFFGL